LTATATNPDGLRSAFDTFNQHSSRLEASYRELCKQVEVLTRQLETEQSARHRELIEKERLGNQLMRTVEALPGAVIVLDGAGTVRERNSKASDLLNRPLLGLAWSDIVRRECVPGESANGDLRLHDGRWLSLSRSSMGSEPGEILLLADVTDSRRMAELLQRAERLSCVGEMTARLAHQIRTPIASALLNVARIHGDDVQQGVAARIRSRLQEVGRMVDDMLQFTAGAERARDRFALGDFYSELAETCEVGLEECRLDVSLLDETMTVAGNRDAIKGAMINLVENARQACGAEGRIELGAEAASDRVCLTVTDNGHGVPPKVLPRLFDPFFTTRPQGTGLGLAVVQSVAEAHGGEVLVDSSGKGSTFALCLPSCEAIQ
jgi:two-component system sensor histidine kinase FlrB